VTLNAVTVVGNHSDQGNSGVGDGGGLALDARRGFAAIGREASVACQGLATLLLAG